MPSQRKVRREWMSPVSRGDMETWSLDCSRVCPWVQACQWTLCKSPLHRISLCCRIQRISNRSDPQRRRGCRKERGQQVGCSIRLGSVCKKSSSITHNRLVLSTNRKSLGRQCALRGFVISTFPHDMHSPRFWKRKNKLYTWIMLYQTAQFDTIQNKEGSRFPMFGKAACKKSLDSFWVRGLFACRDPKHAHNGSR